MWSSDSSGTLLPATTPTAIASSARTDRASHREQSVDPNNHNILIPTWDYYMP